MAATEPGGDRSTTKPGGDSGRIAADVAMAAEAHVRLLTALDGGGFDPAAASRLPGWSVGHVLTHVTNSGDGHARMLAGAARGEVAQQYPGGVAGRAADIEAGAGRGAEEQLADLRRSIGELEARWAESAWEGSGVMTSGAVVPIAELPFLRTREVAIHHIDLGLGAEFADLPAPYVRRELRALEMQWRARRPMGLTGLPAAALALDPHQRLAWFTGRLAVDGLDPAGVF